MKCHSLIDVKEAVGETQLFDLSKVNSGANLIDFESDKDQQIQVGQSVSNQKPIDSVDEPTIDAIVGILVPQTHQDQDKSHSPLSIEVDNLSLSDALPAEQSPLRLPTPATEPLVEMSAISAANISLIESNSINSEHNLGNNTPSPRTAKAQSPTKGAVTQQVPSTGRLTLSGCV